MTMFAAAASAAASAAVEVLFYCDDVCTLWPDQNVYTTLNRKLNNRSVYILCLWERRGWFACTGPFFNRHSIAHRQWALILVARERRVNIHNCKLCAVSVCHQVLCHCNLKMLTKCHITWHLVFALRCVLVWFHSKWICLLNLRGTCSILFSFFFSIFWFEFVACCCLWCIICIFKVHWNSRAHAQQERISHLSFENYLLLLPFDMIFIRLAFCLSAAWMAGGSWTLSQLKSSGLWTFLYVYEHFSKALEKLGFSSNWHEKSKPSNLNIIE